MKIILINFLKSIAVLILFWYSVAIFLTAYVELKYHIEAVITFEVLKDILTIYFCKLWVMLLINLWVIGRFFNRRLKDWRYTRLFLWVFSLFEIGVVLYQWVFLKFYLEDVDGFVMIYKIIYPMINILFVFLWVNIVIFTIVWLISWSKRVKISFKR